MAALTNGNNSKRHHHNSFYTASGGTIKRTNRHMAALDFLLNISMKNESNIREVGLRNITRAQSAESSNNLGSNSLEFNVKMTDDYLLGTDSVGRKLHGAAASMVRIPTELRYCMSRVTEQSAVIRHWEEAMLSRGVTVSGSAGETEHNSLLLNSRMFFSRARGYPIATLSIVKYDAGEEANKLSKLKMDDKRGLEVFALPQRDWRGCSYKLLFKSLAEDRSGEFYFDRGYLYDPGLLDDPNMIHGSHRYVLKTAVTGPVISSIILYVNKNKLKESLNQTFHEKHPQIPPSLTLSKIRNLKKSALLGCLQLEMEVSTVAIAVICFERLCLKGFVTKSNRHLSMAVSLLLAYKFNENVSNKYMQRLTNLLDFFDREWEISKSEVFGAEFGAFIHLGLALHIPHPHIQLVYSELLKLVHRSSRAYLGEEMECLYNQDIGSLETWRKSPDSVNNDST